MTVDVKDGVEKALQLAGSEKDIKRSAKIFEEQIEVTVLATEKKQETSKAKWTGKVGAFLKKIYPIARISLKLASSAGEVSIIIYRLV